MKKCILIALLAHLSLTGALAQASALEIDAQADFLSGQTALTPIPLLGVEPFLAFAVEWKGSPETEIFIRFYENQSGTEGEWIKLENDPHMEREAPSYLSYLGFAPAASTHFQLRTENSGLDLLRCHFYNPGKTEARENPSPGEMEQGGCPCPVPAFQDRLDWCPTGNCPTDPTPVPTAVTHLIVHHSAGANTSSDWAAVVRSIWNHHVNNNGWDDIGYHWLIDPNGVLYAGRGNDLFGAHFCGTNGGTMGVCVMGTYITVPPTQTALESLKKLLGWKACDRNIDPEDFEFHTGSGLNLFNISGHRDGCATACPGDSLYARLPMLRSDVRSYIDQCDITSIVQAPEETAFHLFPNPARDVLHIQLSASIPADFRLRLLDSQGRVVWQSNQVFKGGELLSLPVAAYAKGWYLLQGSPAGPISKVLIQ